MASLNPAKATIFYKKRIGQYQELEYPDQTYINEDAIRNTINYVTRSGKRVDQADDLVCYGAAGIYPLLSPDDYISLFEKVQADCRVDRMIRTRVVHEILSFMPEEEAFLLHHMEMIYPFADSCADVYYRQGHLCVFGVHYGYHEENADTLGDHPLGKKLHIHFIVNAVNHITGNMFDSKLSSKPFKSDTGSIFRIPFGTKKREMKMNDILYTSFLNSPNPFFCADENDYFKNACKLYAGIS